MSASASTADRARAGRVYAHPLKSFFMNKHITQQKLAEMTGISRTRVNHFLNGVYADAEVERKLVTLAEEHGWNGKTPRQTRLCAICRNEEPREGMQVCDTCLGHGRRQEGTRMKEERRICKICGTKFTPYKRGAVYVKNVCSACLTERCAAGNRNMRQAPDSGAGIMIDFTGYPELYDQVSDAARREFRTINQQILYLVAQGIRGKEGER